MKISGIKVIYFSPTGGTKKLAQKFASRVSEKLEVPAEEINITLPDARKIKYSFGPDELVILACPTYAGRVPNKIEPDLRSMFHFDGSPAVALVSFGNRSAGTAPEELADILSSAGAVPFAYGAFVSRHAFSETLARRRPDREDRAELESFADEAAEILLEGEFTCLSGEIGPYYRPLKEDGTPAVFLKAKPLTREKDCYYCGFCVKVCPMGSIDPDCVTVSGICIKCQACVRGCPTKAKYFDDPDFISHVKMLEKNFAERAKNKTVLNTLKRR